MKIQMKWIIVTAIVGLLGLGFQLYTQTPNQEDNGKVEETSISMRPPVKEQRRQKKLVAPKQANSLKFNDSDSHLVSDLDTAESFDETEIFDESSAGIHLRTHFDLLEDTEPGAQERQDESLDEMRETSEVYVEKLTEAYEGLERDNFLARYKILFIMENLSSSFAVPFLSELASSDFPDDIAPYKGDGHVNEPHNEGLIRMRAVGGLNALANEGDKEARKSLLDVAMNAKDRTVKNDAIRAYLSSSQDLETDKEYLKGVLHGKDHQFITLKLSNVEDVQIQLENVDDAQEQSESASGNEPLI